MIPEITNCPGTLAKGHKGYSNTALKRVFGGRKVSHLLPYVSPQKDSTTDSQYEENKRRTSISGVQRKNSIIQVKNKLRLTEEGEQGTHILKPIPTSGKRPEQMPANEHLTMQIASQVYGITTAENALILFKDGNPAYITKRFDIDKSGNKIAQEDFASLAGKTPQTHGDNYKYTGSYLQLFELLERHVPAYDIEALKLFRLIMFNFLFSNGDAHLKNFSLVETSHGDHKLSPAYDLLNSRIHIEDSFFALEEGLVPRKRSSGSVNFKFYELGRLAKLSKQQIDTIFEELTSKSKSVEELIALSYLPDRTKRHFFQTYRTRLRRLT